MLRGVLLAVSAIATGVAAGRAYLSGEVERRKHSAIEAAAEEARARIREQGEAYLARGFRKFARVTALKAVLLVAVWGAHFAGWIPSPAYAVTMSAMLAVFVLRDIWVAFPTVRLGLAELRRHGWKPRVALGETVAASVFDEVLSEASARERTWRDNLVMGLAGRKHDEVLHEIAEAVAGIARETTWQDLKPFLFSAVLRAGILMVLYSALVWSILLL